MRPKPLMPSLADLSQQRNGRRRDAEHKEASRWFRTGEQSQKRKVDVMHNGLEFPAV